MSVSWFQWPVEASQEAETIFLTFRELSARRRME